MKSNFFKIWCFFNMEMCLLEVCLISPSPSLIKYKCVIPIYTKSGNFDFFGDQIMIKGDIFQGYIDLKANDVESIMDDNIIRVKM